MKIIEIKSKKYGLKQVLVDDEDYDFLMQWKWRVRKGKSSNTFYANRGQWIPKIKKQKTIIMHRIIMNPVNSKILVDHRDGNGLNNQKNNLRLATKSQNNANRLSKKGATSSYLGVNLKKQKHRTIKGKFWFWWIAAIKTNNKTIHLGCFPYTPEGEIAAAKCYDEAAKKYHGEFAKLNFPNE